MQACDAKTGTCGGCFTCFRDWGAWCIWNLVPGNLNPAESLYRIDSEWKGRMQDAFAGDADRHVALQSFPGVFSPVWVLGFPKGRRGAPYNPDAMALGSAEPLS